MQGKVRILAMSRGSRETDSQGDQTMLYFVAGLAAGVIALRSIQWLFECEHNESYDQ